MIRHALIVSVLFLSTLSSFAADWPQFRGPTGDGVYEGPTLPLEWGPDKNVVWKTPIPGQGWSSPIVWNDKIYLTTAVEKGGDYSLKAIGVDAKSGKIDWEKELFTEDTGTAPKIHNKNSHASPTAITDGERVYFHFGHMGTAAMSLDGKQVIWKNSKLSYRPVHGNGGSPILVDDKLVFSCDGADQQVVVALNKKTGAVVWKTDRKTTYKKGFSFATATLITENGKKLIISPGSGLVGAYEPSKGAEVWRVTYNGYSLIPRPVFAGGLLYVATGYDSPLLHAIKPEGKGDVTSSNIVWTVKRAVPNTPSVIFAGEELYMVSDGGVASCMNAKTGEVHWSERIPGTFSASPICHDGKIYFTSETGQGTVIAASKEFKILKQNDLKERTFASFAAANGALFVRTDKNLYRFQEKRGN